MAAIRLASLTARPGNSVGQETRLHFPLSGGAAGSRLSATGGRTGFHSIGCIHEAVLFGVSALDQTRVHKQRPEAPLATAVPRLHLVHVLLVISRYNR
jgi:hypothetical protein